MELTIEQNAFLKALSHGQSVVERRTTLPILSHVLMQADGVSLKLTTTDLELSIVETVSADITDPGKITVAVLLLHEIVRKFQDGSKVSIVLNKDTNQLIIASGNSEFKLPCLAPEEFPVIETGDLPHQFKLPAQQFRRLLERTRFAMSQDENRYFLNGVYLHPIENKELRAVATDGHRLAQASIPLPVEAKDMPGVIISRKTVNELLKVIGDMSEDITIALSNNQICCTIRNAYVTSRLVDGIYPDYTGAIPSGNSHVMTLAVKPFSQAVDRVATVSTDKVSGIKANLERGKMELTAANEHTGAAQEILDVDYSGESIDLGFNARYLLDITQQMNEETMQFILGDGDVPVIIRPVNDESALYVLMPMRV